MPERERNPYLDTVPTIEDECKFTVQDLIMGRRPRTVVGVLLEDRETPLTKEAIAGTIGLPCAKVDPVIEMLQDEGWLINFAENGLRKVILTNPPINSESIRPL